MEVIAIQRCSVENQKGAIAVQSVWRYRPSGSQRNIFEAAITPFWLSTDDIRVYV